MLDWEKVKPSATSRIAAIPAAANAVEDRRAHATTATSPINVTARYLPRMLGSQNNELTRNQLWTSFPAITLSFQNS
jgi:hypothetical protein